MTLAKVTCKNCGWSWVKVCSLGYEAEKDFYLNHRPRCRRCFHSSWTIEEVVEVNKPISEAEKDLFSLSEATKKQDGRL